MFIKSSVNFVYGFCYHIFSDEMEKLWLVTFKIEQKSKRQVYRSKRENEAGVYKQQEYNEKKGDGNGR